MLRKVHVQQAHAPGLPLAQHAFGACGRHQLGAEDAVQVGAGYAQPAHLAVGDLPQRLGDRRLAARGLVGYPPDGSRGPVLIAHGVVPSHSVAPRPQ